MPKRTDLIDEESWVPTPEQAAGITFNENKVQVAKVEALLSGFLEKEAVTEELVHAAEEHLLRVTKNQRELRNSKALKKEPFRRQPMT